MKDALNRLITLAEPFAGEEQHPSEMTPTEGEISGILYWARDMLEHIDDSPDTIEVDFIDEVEERIQRVLELTGDNGMI